MSRSPSCVAALAAQREVASFIDRAVAWYRGAALVATLAVSLGLAAPAAAADSYPPKLTCSVAAARAGTGRLSISGVGFAGGIPARLVITGELVRRIPISELGSFTTALQLRDVSIAAVRITATGPGCRAAVLVPAQAAPAGPPRSAPTSTPSPHRSSTADQTIAASGRGLGATWFLAILILVAIIGVLLLAVTGRIGRRN